MKKKRILLGIALTAASIFALSTVTSCNNTSDGEGEVETDKWTVKFDTQGGSKIDDVQVDKGTAVAKPTDPTKANSTFVGWYKEKACTNEWDFTKPITEDRTLYAKWEESDVVLGLGLSGTYKTRFKKGDTFDATGLVVKENHSIDDDVTLDASKYTISLEKEDGTPVDKTQAFSEAGFYSAVVKAGDVQAKYDFKVTATAETIVNYELKADDYGTANPTTEEMITFNANDEIADLAEHKIKLYATGSKVRYQIKDSTHKEVSTTYSGATYNTRMQVHTGADGALKLVLTSDAEITLLAKAALGAGVSIKNADTTQSEKDPKNCLVEGGNAEDIHELKYYVNAGTYLINAIETTTYFNIYSMKIDLYEPVIDDSDPVTDLTFAGQKTKFYEGDTPSTSGLTVTATKGGAPLPVGLSDTTIKYYKADGTTEVTSFSEAGTYKVAVTYDGFTKMYDVNYYLSSKIELSLNHQEAYVAVGATDVEVKSNIKVTFTDDAITYKNATNSLTKAYFAEEACTTPVSDPFAATSIVYAKVTYSGTETGVSSTDSKLEKIIKVNVLTEINKFEFDKADLSTETVSHGGEYTLATNNELVSGVNTVGSLTVKADKADKGLGCLGVAMSRQQELNKYLNITVQSGKQMTIRIYIGSGGKDKNSAGIKLIDSSNNVVTISSHSDISSTPTADNAGITDISSNAVTVRGSTGDAYVEYVLTEGTYKFGSVAYDNDLRIHHINVTIVNA